MKKRFRWPMLSWPAFCFFVAAPAAAQPSVPDVFGLDREPYVRWTTHTGAPEEAAVHVRVTLRDAESGETEVREGGGFVVRCDGFVLVPAALLAPTTTGKDGQARRVPREAIQTTLTFAGADGATPPQSVSPPRFWTQSEPLGFALLKVNDLHFKGIPLLHPRNVRAGGAVEVVYPVSSPSGPGKVQTVVVPATVGAADAGGARFAFAGDGPRVLPGALVVDAESRLAIGIVPGAAREGEPPKTASHFLSFAGFHRISNAVGLLPDPDAREQPDRPDGESDGMIRIPGGPVALIGQPARDHAALYGKWVVCTPGFWIDEREVTNAEYREFLVETRHPRRPVGWVDLSGSDWWRESPVLGVSGEDAAAYAAWRGKRLVTPVEWARASAGAEVRFAEYRAALEQAASPLVPALTVPIPLEAGSRVLSRGRRSPSVLGASGTFFFDGEELRRLRTDREEQIEAFHATMQFPRAVVPAGWRAWDESVWGVRDVAINVYELLQPNFAHRRTEVARKQLPALLIEGLGQRSPGVGPATSLVFAYGDVPGPRAGTGRIAVPTNRYGFRCAR